MLISNPQIIRFIAVFSLSDDKQHLDYRIDLFRSGSMTGRSTHGGFWAVRRT
jgi:hypothetical protein